MDKSNIKVIIFDIDGTLIDGISWLKMTESLGADVQIHKKIFEELKNEKISYPESKSQLINLWLSTNHANKQNLLYIFNSWNLKIDAKEIINYLKSKYEVILISGSLDLYVKTIAKKLNIKTWYANTTIFWDKNNKIYDFNYEENQAKKKLEQLNQFLYKSGYKKENCLIIGDGDSDLILFKELSYGIAINKKPFLELEKLAWKKITNLSEIKELL
ncbi:MAG: HAD-IB family phosphatase [bacterium]|nr:HAD-IB family phosphatase [bacterium]